MGQKNNFYAPYYRHITLNSWATCNEDTINRRYHTVSFNDVQKAFQYFINTNNNNRPFILAGFSQGGKSVVELIKTMLLRQFFMILLPSPYLQNTMFLSYPVIAAANILLFSGSSTPETFMAQNRGFTANALLKTSNNV